MEEKDAGREAGLETLQEIRQLMEKGSRFISLSGLSGVAAGLCGLGGAWLAYQALGWRTGGNSLFTELTGPSGASLETELYKIGIGTFLSAFALAFLFTWLRSKRNN